MRGTCGFSHPAAVLGWSDDPVTDRVAAMSTPSSDTPPAGMRARFAPLWPILGAYRGRWALALFVLLAAAGATLAVPQAFRLLIDTGLTSAAVDARFLQMVGLALLLALFTGMRFYLMSWLGERVVADIRERVFSAVLTQPPVFFESLRVGEVLSRLTADTTLVQTLVGTSVSMALRSGVMLAGGVVMMALTSAWLTGLMVGLLTLVVLPMWAMGRRVRGMSRSSQDRVADTSALAGEVLTAMPTVQAFVREGWEAARYGRAVEDAFDTARRRIVLRSTLTVLGISLAFGVIVLVLWLGAREVAAGEMSNGALAQFVLYAALVAGSMGALSEVWGDLQRAAGATERLAELMQPAPARLGRSAGAGGADMVEGRVVAAGATRAVEAPGVPRVETLAVAFERVRFCYPSRPQTTVLDDFSMQLPVGETWALVGPSGAGKTTVFQLILGFHLPQAGRVTVGGLDSATACLAQLRAGIGVVAQEPAIFAVSVAENIRYGRLSANDAEIRAAARAAHADGFVEALPQGYDTLLGERGLQLSGGQRQRIAIARAVLKDPPLLLLDEATSALDTESEQAVQAALDELLPGRSALVIAHRLSTVQKADRILVMDAGRVVEQGTHPELLQAGGLYARLAAAQFAGT
ncbi:MAG: ATP-binding cassette domain-containing protein [Betaproteobacteria bacterium]|nr:ATP-binding cassette domain-containing protein [Betaproteobacteria bacterium]